MRFFEDLRRGVGDSARTNGLAYGYSVVITGAFGIVHAEHGGPTVGQSFLFALGASVTFTIASAVVTRGFRQRVEREPPVVAALAISLSFISVTAGLGASALVAWGTAGWLAWLLAPLFASAVYLVASGVESALARSLHLLAGTDRIEDR